MPLDLTEAAIVGDVQSLLNDTAGQVYTAAVLLPYTQQEYYNLQSRVISVGLPLLRTWSADRTSVANSPLSISRAVAGFEEFIEPVKVVGRRSGSSDPFLPLYRIEDDVNEQNALTQSPYPSGNGVGWTWFDNVLTIMPSSSVQDYRILYYRNTSPYAFALTAGYTISDMIEFRNYLTHKIAAKAGAVIGRMVERATLLNDLAEADFIEQKARLVKGEQDLPIRRRGFWSSRKRRGLI